MSIELIIKKEDESTEFLHQLRTFKFSNDIIVSREITKYNSDEIICLYKGFSLIFDLDELCKTRTKNLILPKRINIVENHFPKCKLLIDILKI